LCQSRDANEKVRFKDDVPDVEYEKYETIVIVMGSNGTNGRAKQSVEAAGGSVTHENTLFKGFT
jgi:hypothetical protein